MSKQYDPRRLTFAPPTWWLESVQAATQLRGAQLQLLAEIKSRFGKEYDTSEISRCISGDRVLVELAQEISWVLGIGQPIFIPLTPDESVRMAKERELTELRILAEPRLTQKVDPKIRALEESVRAAKSANDTNPENARIRSDYEVAHSGSERTRMDPAIRGSKKTKPGAI